MENKIDLQDALDASIIFAKALGFILQDKQGIIVDVPQESKVHEMIQKVVVFKFNDRVHIYKCDDDLVEGTAVLLDTDVPEQQN
jgi:hypothetical protein